jgi:predicted nucleic acid-binding protein
LGLTLDSSVLIAAERRAQPVSGLLRTIKETTGQTVVVISAVSVIEIAHGIWRANTEDRAARIDAEARKTGTVIPFADLQIGVTALELGHAIATRNMRHFQMIPGLTVIPL